MNTQEIVKRLRELEAQWKEWREDADRDCENESLDEDLRNYSAIESLTFHTCTDGIRELIRDIRREEPPA